MPEATKKKLPFYQLTEKEVTDFAKDKLTKGQILVFLLLRTKAYRGKRGKSMDTALIAERIGIDRRSVQRALKALTKKGYINTELNNFDYICCKDYGDNNVVPATRMSPGNDRNVAETTKMSPPSPETRSGQGLQKSPEYTDIYIELSEREREFFLKYVESHTTNFKTQIICLESWLFSKTSVGNLRFTRWWEKYQAHLAREAKIKEKQNFARANSGMTSFRELESDNQGKSIQKQLNEQEIEELLEETRRRLGRGKNK